MKSDNVDDIFKDFEHKVTGKEDSSKKPEKLNEEEHLKIKYQEAENSLKNKYKKEKEALKEEKRKDLIKQGKTPSQSSNTEKFAYIGVILVLVLYIGIDFSFYHGEEKNNADQQTITAKVVDEEEVVIEENITEEVVEEEEETVEEEVVEEEVELSGVITLTLDRVFAEVVDEDDDLGYITKVTFTIDNGKDKVLAPTVTVFAYDDELHESWETRSRGTYTYAIGIKPGDQHAGTISVSPKTFRNLNIDKVVRIEMNSTEEGFIAAKSKTITIS